MCTNHITVAGIREVSLVDMIGHPCYVIWLPGCNFKCPWCQNTHVVEGRTVIEVSIEELRRELEEASKIVDYIHITGGEPTLHPALLSKIFSIAKDVGLKCSVDTNGSNPKVIKDLIAKGLLDHVAIDLKSSPYRQENLSIVAGIPRESVRDVWKRIILTLNYSCRNGLEVEARTTFVPGLLSLEDILDVGRWLKEEFGEYKIIYVIQQFNPSPTVRDPNFRRVKPTPRSILLDAGLKVKELYGLNVYIRLIEETLKL